MLASLSLHCACDGPSSACKRCHLDLTMPLNCCSKERISPGQGESPSHPSTDHSISQDNLQTPVEAALILKCITDTKFAIKLCSDATCRESFLF